MANANEPRRRFAPVPIETTFQSVRKGPQPGNPQLGPHAELTPDASPRTPSPVPRELGERRRFAPQLIETSRRTRRAGDPGPATKPADKTDITPYTKNIYTAKPKTRRKPSNTALHEDDEDEEEMLRRMPPTRRETEDEGVQEYLLELAAKEADRQIQEAALAAFPNSQAREGGVAHFYFNESSDGENSPENVSPAEQRVHNRVRRKSSDVDVSWWQKHMQDHAQQLSRERGEQEQPGRDDEDVDMITDAELDKMELPAPPEALWTTTSKIAPEDRRESMADVGPLNDSPATAQKTADQAMADAPPVVVSKAPELPYPASSFKPPPASEGLGRSFGAFGMTPDSPQLEKMRKAASPPMLGKDLVFRECPSPKWTKLEPNHPFAKHQEETKSRDDTGEGGLWGGYCVKRGADGTCLAYEYPEGPRLLATPAVPGTPLEEHGDFDWSSPSDEPVSMFSGSTDSTSGLSVADHRSRNVSRHKPTFSVTSLDERLHQEKIREEKMDKITQEFNDEFITQVYNYLSLGYPATACIFDEELSKITHMSQADLKKEDEAQMAKGHMLEMKLDETRHDEPCPRWKALKTYIHEWARQHPNLDNLDSQHWGVRERRGSWAI